MKPVREAGQPPPQQMFLAPALDLPSRCSSSVVSSVAVAQDHGPGECHHAEQEEMDSPSTRLAVGSPTHWRYLTQTACGSREDHQHHGHLQKGPSTMGAPWPSSSLLLPLHSCHSSDSIGGIERPQKLLLFYTLCMAKKWRRGWCKALVQTSL